MIYIFTTNIPAKPDNQHLIIQLLFLLGQSFSSLSYSSHNDYYKLILINPIDIDPNILKNNMILALANTSLFQVTLSDANPATQMLHIEMTFTAMMYKIIGQHLASLDLQQLQPIIDSYQARTQNLTKDIELWSRMLANPIVKLDFLAQLKMNTHIYQKNLQIDNTLQQMNSLLDKVEAKEINYPQAVAIWKEMQISTGIKLDIANTKIPENANERDSFTIQIAFTGFSSGIDPSEFILTNYFYFIFDRLEKLIFDNMYEPNIDLSVDYSKMYCAATWMNFTVTDYQKAEFQQKIIETIWDAGLEAALKDISITYRSKPLLINTICNLPQDHVMEISTNWATLITHPRNNSPVYRPRTAQSELKTKLKQLFNTNLDDITIIKEKTAMDVIVVKKILDAIEKKHYLAALHISCGINTETATNIVRILLSYQQALSINILGTLPNSDDTAITIAEKNHCKATLELLKRECANYNLDDDHDKMDCKQDNASSESSSGRFLFR